MKNRPVQQAAIVPAESIARLIYSVREQRVILDKDLARMYEVETRALNQAVKRNQERFPPDFMFKLTREEILGMSQTVISLASLKFSKQVRAFTEHGALMAANILNSSRAVAMSLYVIRAFIKMREDLAANAVILKRLAEIDKTLLMHDGALRDIFQKLRPLLEPPPPPPKPEIGFHIKEESVPYRTGKVGFEKGRSYPRNRILHDLGAKDSKPLYVFHKNGSVLGFGLNRWQNPKAPLEILVGYGENREPFAEDFIKRKPTVPIFIREDRNSHDWTCAGYFTLKDSTDEPSEKNRRVKPTDVPNIYKILFLEEVPA